MRTKLVILLMIFLFSCGRESSREKNNTSSVLEIDLLSEPEFGITKLSEIAENVEYIPLQTTDSSLLGDLVRKIVNIDNKVYILNSGLEDEILCFNTDGKFSYKINKTGRGPEEYLSITDFDISYDNSLLTIFSSSDSRLMVYGISESGFTFQRSVSLSDPRPYRIAVVPETDKIFLAIPPWTGTEPTLSLLINTVGDTIHFKQNCYKYEIVGGKQFRAFNEVLIYSIEDKVCFKETFSDTVFFIDAKENSFMPRIIFESHGTFVTPEMKSGSETPRNNTNWIANIFETSKYVFYWYGTSFDRYRILYDKKTNAKYKLDVDNESRTLMKNDLSGGPDFNIDFFNNYCSSGKLFSFVDAIILKKYVAGEDFKNSKVMDTKKKDELKKLADSLKETDNPVLVIVTPKE